MSLFNNITEAAPIEVFFMNKKCLDEPNPNKVNLTTGAYRTEEGKNWVLPVVHEAEVKLAEDPTLDHEYLPVLGLDKFTRAASELVLGADNVAIKEGRAFGIQCLSGTGSLRAGAEFLNRLLGYEIVYVSEPTWDNHKLIFKNSNYTTVKSYRYWDAKNSCLDFDGFYKDLENAPEKSVIVLHGCAHNPTGMDPTHEQWKQLCELIKRKKVFPFFDIAYQGFASGDPDADAWAIRYFVEQGVELVVAQSFAKNMGLYNERVGNLTIVVSDPKTIPAIKSQITLIIRANWSNPPAHGARVVAMILTNPEYRQQWLESIKIMSSRIREMRHALRGHLESLGTPGTWNHITEQIGMFSYVGLTPEQINHMVNVHKVFLLSSSRINVCGLNTKNVKYVAEAIDDAVRKNQSHL